MPPERPLLPTSLEHLEVMLTDDGSRTLRDRRLDETFHSGCGALSECLHVYLRNSGIEALLQQSAQNQSESQLTQSLGTIRVLEFGFGTGMNALLTVTAARAYRAPLEYVSLEHALLPRDVLDQMHIGAAVDLAIERTQLPAEYAVASELEGLWLDFRSSLPLAPPAGEYVWRVADEVELRLKIGDAVGFTVGLREVAAEPYDAIYLDAFSPASNPELWSAELFSNLRTALRPSGLLVSYCVSGHVRRGLQQAGFDVTRLPGPPGGKREVLAARVTGKSIHERRGDSKTDGTKTI